MSFGDVDADGIPDVYASGWGNANYTGRVYVHSGKDGELLRTYTCKQSGDTFGFDATGLGDVDGDGGIDFLLTSAWSPARGSKTGRVFVIAGPVSETHH